MLNTWLENNQTADDTRAALDKTAIRLDRWRKRILESQRRYRGRFEVYAQDAEDAAEAWPEDPDFADLADRLDALDVDEMKPVPRL